MPNLSELKKTNPFDRFEICLAYFALEYDWNKGGWVRERPSNRRRRESIGVQLDRIGYRPPFDAGGFESLLPDDTYDGFYDEHDAARESYIHALIAWGLAPRVDPYDDLGQYIADTYVASFIDEHFPQLTKGRVLVTKSTTSSWDGSVHTWGSYERAPA